MDYIIALEFMVIIACLLVGARYGGYGLGLISGLGLLVFAFVFHLAPGKPPVDVLLTIMAVIGCASVLQTAGGLNVMMRVAERVLRRNPKYITVLAPITTWTLTVMCGTGHVVYTMFPIIYDIAIKEGVRPERPMAGHPSHPKSASALLRFPWLSFRWLRSCQNPHIRSASCNYCPSASPPRSAAYS